MPLVPEIAEESVMALADPRCGHCSAELPDDLLPAVDLEGRLVCESCRRGDVTAACMDCGEPAKWPHHHCPACLEARFME